MQPLDLEIREQLARYLGGEIRLRDFEQWFVWESWNVHQAGNPIAEELVGEIELRLAEFSNKDWTEDELRALLLRLMESGRTAYGEWPVTTGSSSQVSRSPVALSLPWAARSA